MTIQIDPNAFRMRMEAKVNIIAKAINWVVGISIAGLAYLYIRNQSSIGLDPNVALFAALGVGGIASWLIVERPMKQIEKRLPLFDDDDY